MGKSRGFSLKITLIVGLWRIQSRKKLLLLCPSELYSAFVVFNSCSIPVLEIERY